MAAQSTAYTCHHWTMTDLEPLPEGYHYELADGVLYMAPLPGLGRGLVLGNLLAILSPWVRSHRLGRTLFGRCGLCLDESTYLNPDLLFFHPDQLPRLTGEQARTATLAVDIFPQSSVRMPLDTREALFSRAEVTELWRVDYQARTLQLRRLLDGSYVTKTCFRGRDAVCSGELPGLSFPLTALWEDLRE